MAEKPLTIGIDIRSLAAGRRTGVEEYVAGLLRALFELDSVNRYVLFFNAWGKVEPDLHWIADFPNVELRRFHFPNKILNVCLWYFKWPKLDRLIGGADVFFMPNLNFAAFSREVRVVVTVHDLSFELFPKTFAWKQRLWHYFVNIRSLLRRANAVIAVSQSTRADLERKFGLPSDRLHAITSGVSARFAPMNRNDGTLLAVQKKYALPYRFILALGTVEPRKNWLALVEAFDAFRQSAVGEEGKYELVLAGSPGWKERPFFERIAASPVRDHIHSIGFIADADKPAFYNLASVLVYPSLYEGFGFPPLEALACGVPTIASHSASLPEIIGEAGVLIDPYRPDDIVRALRAIVRDRELRERLSKAGIERRSLFTWRRAATETLAVLTGTSQGKP